MTTISDDDKSCTPLKPSDADYLTNSLTCLIVNRCYFFGSFTEILFIWIFVCWRKQWKFQISLKLLLVIPAHRALKLLFAGKPVGGHRADALQVHVAAQFGFEGKESIQKLFGLFGDVYSQGFRGGLHFGGNVHLIFFRRKSGNEPKVLDFKPFHELVITRANLSLLPSRRTGHNAAF